MGELGQMARNPRLLYKQVFVPDFPNAEVAFFGFARPAFGAIPPCSEMQSRMYSMVTNGDLKLECTDELKKRANTDRQNYEWRFGSFICIDVNRKKDNLHRHE